VLAVSRVRHTTLMSDSRRGIREDGRQDKERYNQEGQ
jgi:hypothetical protein